ncbi:hypothetical protein HMPREF1425_00003 [Helicobacter pylori GAM71Ai]|nr:hypothetical protein HMPREF1406_00598 [Helicobacter pylori GAM239Bi]EMH38764.1 hypothetical protein HMPREF1425_00003 [Helicobacter pylori GAM71Ai]EMJ41178.1 hypothetical protein HMPREF1432_00606 [Helicobacter pylori GAMchJs114i]
MFSHLIFRGSRGITPLQAILYYKIYACPIISILAWIWLIWI